MSHKGHITSVVDAFGERLQPVCTCGWKGRAVHWSHNLQHTVINDEAMRHLAQAREEERQQRIGEAA